jgi:hypothetical protein
VLDERLWDFKPVTINNVRVLEVHVDFVLCGVADQTFVVREGEMGRSCAISLVLCNDSIFEQTALIQIVVGPPGRAEVHLEDALRGASKVSRSRFLFTSYTILMVECTILSTCTFP